MLLCAWAALVSAARRRWGVQRSRAACATQPTATGSMGVATQGAVHGACTDPGKEPTRSGGG